MSSPRQSACEYDFDHDEHCKGDGCVVFSDVVIADVTTALKKDSVGDKMVAGGGENEGNNARSETYSVPVLETKPPNYMWLALCTTIFFNPLSGIVALVLAMQADAEYMRNSYEQARRLGRVVKFICIVSIVVTVVVLIIISSFFVTPPAEEIKS